MKIQMNLLQNSHDYFTSSIDFFYHADEFGDHNKDTCKYENKIQYKMAILCLIQALELLFKECLFRINPILIYDNIDNKNTTKSKTINFEKAFYRIANLKNYIITKEQNQLIGEAVTLRNKIVHFQFDFESENIKTAYCRLYKLYKYLHQKFIIDQEVILNEQNQKAEISILHFIEFLTPFRGTEVPKDSLKAIKKYIFYVQKHVHSFNNLGTEYQRIRYGDEPKIPKLLDIHGEGFTTTYNREYCGDCLAKIGEYHSVKCDLEVCPKCYGQVLSCGCFDLDSVEEYIDDNL